jgi:general secretion pathway protein L
MMWDSDRTGMLVDFLTWWWQQLCDVVPPQWRSRGVPRDGLFVMLDALPSRDQFPAARIYRRRAGREKEIGRYSLDEAGTSAAGRAISGTEGRTTPTVIVLPPMALIEREVILPFATERDARRVLQYEMGRLTPFSAEDVFWNWAIEHRDRVLNRLHVQLWLVPKAALQLTLAALERTGIRPAVIMGRTEVGQMRRIRLVTEPSRGERWQRRVLTAGIAACILLAAAAAVQPFIRQSLQLAALKARIAALRPRVDAAEATRRRIAAVTANGDVLTAEYARLGDAMQAIAVVTEALPDDTYLTDFTLNERKLTLAGQSAAAAKLIATLSATTTIRNPAFAAPVTRAENGSADAFSIRADFAP